MTEATVRSGIDTTNTKACDAKTDHRCALLAAALNEKNGQIARAFSYTTGAERVVFYFKKRNTPYLVFSHCPFCGQPLETKKTVRQRR